MSKFEAGLVIVSDPGSDIPLLEEKTYQCVHCGRHFQVRKGSGIIRVFCTNCNGYYCGPNCVKCVPTEQLLENYEQGKPLDFRPVRVSIPCPPP